MKTPAEIGEEMKLVAAKKGFLEGLHFAANKAIEFNELRTARTLLDIANEEAKGLEKTLTELSDDLAKII